MFKVQGSFIRHILNYTGYNQQWNVKNNVNVKTKHCLQNKYVGGFWKDNKEITFFTGGNFIMDNGPF